LSSKRRRQSGPMTAAGLISFYDEYEGKIKMTPTALVFLAGIFAFMVIAAHIIG